MKDILEELNWRGLIYQKTPDIESALKKKSSVYLGIDPTGPSLHLGHLLGILILKRFLNFGHKIFILIGGGTALIGDPSGKSKERLILSKTEIEKNKRKIKKQLNNFFNVNNEKITIVDNFSWLKNIRIINFLRETGKLISVNSMLDLEFIKNRLSSDEGVSFAEFSYQLLQAYDFLLMNDRYQVEIQIGGSDQMGNIVQGIELIRKKSNKKVYGLTYPLLINPKTGKKFGKTEDGETIWLDKNLTSPFYFYQFILNISDDLAPILLRFYSFKSKDEIELIEREWQSNKSCRLIQKVLAEELLDIVFGREEKNKVLKLNNLLFAKKPSDLSLDDIQFLKGNLNYKKIKNFSFENIILETGLVKSKNEARRLIEQNGVKIYNLINEYYLVKKGKNEFCLIKKIK